MCQCPLGLLPHFYTEWVLYYLSDSSSVSMPSRAVTSFLHYEIHLTYFPDKVGVNALSGCYLISTHLYALINLARKEVCQCPLGLLPHFYTGCSNWYPYSKLVCQCPLGLLPHFYCQRRLMITLII